jgi:mannose-6-phosphate isomerase-like protein (cupin superfamily)
MTEEITFLDSRARIHASSAQTDGFALIEVVAPAGHQPPLHVHDDEDEGFYVLEGELTLWVGEDTRTLGAGDFLLAPRQVPHTVRSGAGGGRWLVTAGPRFEAFVRAVAATAPAPDDIKRLAAEHGIAILGPPGMLPSELPARAA